MIRKDSFLKTGRFDANLHFLADLDWLCRMHKQVGFHFACEEFFPLDCSLEPTRASDKLRRLEELWIVLRRHFGLAQALIGWLAQHPLSAISNWIQRRRKAQLGDRKLFLAQVK